MNNKLQFNVSSGQRLIAFVCVCVLFFILGSVITGVISYGRVTAARLRIATVVQDVMLFIMPAVVTAVVISRRPADFLMVGKAPSLLVCMLTVAVVIASIPAMNLLVKWNMSMSLPDSMTALEAWMRSSEKAAQEFTEMLIGGTGVKNLIVALLIVGVLAAFSEELFFRGSLQRVLLTCGMNVHVAVWVTAFIFSAVHMQFFGFIPRLVLGAGFGYIVVWSGNVWLGVLAHFTNNAIAAVGITVARTNRIIGSACQECSDITSNEVVLAFVSAAVVSVLLVLLRKALNQTSCG